MVIMTETERTAIIEMVMAYNTGFTMQNKAKVEEIKEKFLNDFTVDVTKEPEYIIRLLEIAYLEKKADDVEYSLIIGFSFNLFTKEYTDILLKLLEADWHYKHEDIAWIFQRLKIPEAVNLLYVTALKQFKYLEEDEFFALAVKCIWALGDINTKESKEKLEILAQSSNETIKKNALNQLERNRAKR